MGEEEFLEAQLLEFGLVRGRLLPEDGIHRVLRGVGETGFEGPETSGPVETGGEALDGTERTAGPGSDSAERAPALEAKVGDEGREVGRVFIRLALPRTRSHGGWGMKLET